MSGSGPLGPSFLGVWQSLQPSVVTRYLPRSSGARAVVAAGIGWAAGGGTCCGWPHPDSAIANVAHDKAHNSSGLTMRMTSSGEEVHLHRDGSTGCWPQTSTVPRQRRGSSGNDCLNLALQLAAVRDACEVHNSPSRPLYSCLDAGCRNSG